jgi:hypothetical protein
MAKKPPVKGNVTENCAFAVYMTYSVILGQEIFRRIESGGAMHCRGVARWSIHDGGGEVPFAGSSL